MAKIKQLSPLEAQKIAAGEVVERPANVVKELIENALDAGATDIALYLEEGGKKLIRVVDNGCGMSPEDAHMAIRHHATSKITTVDDLERISTYGFRGEALSSIAAVSTLILTTKEDGAVSALSLTIVEGTVKQESLVARNTGTDIEVHDLFFNVPARKKFLKTKETEWRTIAHLFHALCLTYQQVSFRVYHDDRLVYNIPASFTLADRLAQLFEPALIKNSVLLKKKQERMNLHVHGALTDNSYVRYDRSSIFLFVNNRWVKNHKLTQAFIKGYQGMLPPQRYPAGFIFITLDPLFVDINIHPRKEEVQFLHPRIVEVLIEEAVQEALEARLNRQLGSSQKLVETGIKEPARLLKEPIISLFGLQAPAYDSSDRNDEKQKQTFLTVLERNFVTSAHGTLSQGTQSEQPPVEQSVIDQSLIKQSMTEQPGKSTTLSSIAQAPFDPLEINTPSSHCAMNACVGQDHSDACWLPQTPAVNSYKEPQIESNTTLNYRLIGQLQTTYIMIETEAGLVLIDQHAAHERIVYERMRSRFDDIARVRLLFPQIITLTSTDISLFEPYLEQLSHFGIEAQRISDHEIAIQETPVFLKNQSLEESIKEAIGVLHEYHYLEQDELKKILHERVHAHLSCKAAIKAGDEMSIESMHELIKDLYKTDNKLTCPHGRPTIWELKGSDIQKKFKRDYR